MILSLSKHLLEYPFNHPFEHPCEHRYFIFKFMNNFFEILNAPNNLIISFFMQVMKLACPLVVVFSLQLKKEKRKLTTIATGEQNLNEKT